MVAIGRYPPIEAVSIAHARMVEVPCMTLPWERLRDDLPRIIDQLSRMMIDEALPAILDGVEATPAVAIEFTLADGSGAFEVRLSIDMVEPNGIDRRGDGG